MNNVMNKKFVKQIEYDIYEKSNEWFLNCDAKKNVSIISASFIGLKSHDIIFWVGQTE